MRLRKAFYFSYHHSPHLTRTESPAWADQLSGLLDTEGSQNAGFSVSTAGPSQEGWSAWGEERLLSLHLLESRLRGSETFCFPGATKEMGVTASAQHLPSGFLQKHPSFYCPFCNFLDWVLTTVEFSRAAGKRMRLSPLPASGVRLLTSAHFTCPDISLLHLLPFSRSRRGLCLPTAYCGLSVSSHVNGFLVGNMELGLLVLLLLIFILASLVSVGSFRPLMFKRIIS